MKVNIFPAGNFYVKHKAKVLTKKEVEANRSNAYEYLDFSKELLLTDS